MGEHPDIVPLEQLGGALADGERDYAGWQVVAADGTRVGRVRRVLVETTSRRVRYLDVDVAGHLLPGRRDRQVLIPASQALPARARDTVLVQRLRGDDIANLPPFGEQAVTREYELEWRDRVGNRMGVQPVEEQGFLGLPGKQDREAAG